jgi:PiT family inorganic phosphate transporter
MNLLYGYLTIISGIYGAYVLGANTVGLIVGMIGAPKSQYPPLSLGFGLATILGMVFLSRGTTRSVAENIVGMSPSASFAAQMGGAITVHSFTQFGIPVSVSQAVIGGVFGAAIPRNIVVRNDRLTKEIILGWTVAPLVGAILAYLFASIV